MDVLRHRRARIDDFHALVALEREADEYHAQVAPRYFRRSTQTQRTLGELTRILNALDEVLFVYDDPDHEHSLLGLVHAQLYDTPRNPTMVFRRRVHLDNLIITSSARGRGLGRQLVTAAADWGRAKGAEEMILTVWAGNPAAEHFYADLGFHRVSSVLGKPL